MRPIEGPKVMKLVTWCCKKKGQVKVNVKWINDKFPAEAPIQCIVDVDNSESLVKIKNISVTGYCNILARANYSYTCPFKIVMFSWLYHIEIPPGGKKEGKSYEFDLNESKDRIDFTNIHSMKGNILECGFYLDFKLNLDINCLCCGDEPLVSTIFFVKPQLKVEAPQITSPQDWNPQILKSVSIAYDPSFEANDKGESQFYRQYKSGNPNIDNTTLN